MVVLEWKERVFIEKVNSRCFCWFLVAILVDLNGPPKWRLHTKLYKGVWNVSANNSETVGHKDLRFGQIVYILVFYNISFSWLLPLDGLQFIFLLRDSENDLQKFFCHRQKLVPRFLATVLYTGDQIKMASTQTKVSLSTSWLRFQAIKEIKTERKSQWSSWELKCKYSLQENCLKKEVLLHFRFWSL